MQITPGPWTYSEPTEQIIGPNGETVVFETGVNEANCRLIAAAPDMLAALEDIIQRNEIQHWFNLDKARAAVAKAKG